MIQTRDARDQCVRLESSANATLTHIVEFTIYESKLQKELHGKTDCMALV